MAKYAIESAAQAAVRPPSNTPVRSVTPDIEAKTRQIIRLLLQAKDHEALNKVMLTWGLHFPPGDAAELERIATEEVQALTDHDLRHFWLEEACPCQDHHWN